MGAKQEQTKKPGDATRCRCDFQVAHGKKQLLNEYVFHYARFSSRLTSSILQHYRDVRKEMIDLKRYFSPSVFDY